MVRPSYTSTIAPSPKRNTPIFGIKIVRPDGEPSSKAAPVLLTVQALLSNISYPGSGYVFNGVRT